MVATFRVPRLAVVCVCVVISLPTATAASELPAIPSADSGQPATSIATAALPAERQPLHLSFDPARLPALAPAPSNAFEGQYYRGRSRRRHDAALTAVVIGAAAAIAGAAVLTYANRPECSVSQANSGCGYGTKVIGTSVLAGGVVSMFAGALTW